MTHTMTFCQGIEEIQERKLSKSFSPMLTMAKTFEELFTSTLDEIAVSVQYGSSTPVVINAGLNN